MSDDTRDKKKSRTPSLTDHEQQVVVAWERYASRILAILRRDLDARTAEDALMEIFARLLSLSEFPEPVWPWLCRWARNEVGRQRRVEDPIYDFPKKVPIIRQGLVPPDLVVELGQVLDLLQLLDTVDRLIFEEAWVRGSDTHEVAQALKENGSPMTDRSVNRRKQGLKVKIADLLEKVDAK